MIFSTLVAFVLALGLALVLVPIFRSVAVKAGLIDKPDLVRKLHLQPVSLGGGIAVFCAMSLAFAAAIWFDRNGGGDNLGKIQLKYYHLFWAAGAILMLGFIDDLYALRGRQKLLVQCLIIAALVGAGTRIDVIGLFGFTFDLGLLAFPVTVLWLVVAVNALNLIDGADGVASTVGGVICFGLGCMSVTQNLPLNAAVCFALSGALTGFLWFNKPPASIYLGDAGSMMIGLLVGVLAIWSNLKDSTILSSAPIAILAIPLFDSSAAILRRWLTGRSIYTTDRGHLHHVLQHRWGNRGMLLFVFVLCGSTTLMSVLSVTLRTSWLAGVGTVLVLALLIGTRSFGHAEFRLLSHCIGVFANSFAVAPYGLNRVRRRTQMSIQGNGDWATVWEPLVDFADRQDLAAIKMDINLAWLHQGYHANWQAERMPEKALQMTLLLPLMAHRPTDGELIPIGNLRVIAQADDKLVYGQLATLSDYLLDLRAELDKVVEKIHAQIFIEQSLLERSNVGSGAGESSGSNQADGEVVDREPAANLQSTSP